MGISTDLEHKWTTIRESRDTVEAYDLHQATSGSFYMVYNDRGGDGPCAIDVTAVGAFEDVSDCLAYLRYHELPEMLVWRSTFEQEALPDDDPLAELDQRLIDDSQALAASLGSALETEPADEALEALRVSWNETFALTNPGSTIEAWGTLAQVLGSPQVSEVLEDEDLDGEYDELMAQVRGGEFDADDITRFATAVEALGAVERS